MTADVLQIIVKLIELLYQFSLNQTNTSNPFLNSQWIFDDHILDKSSFILTNNQSTL